jgi:excisionase family DNA binding protein
MTLHQVSEYLDCSYATALLLVMRDGLLIFRLGAAGDGWRVRRSDLDQWIAARHVQPAGSGLKARKQKPAPKKPAPRRGRSRK